METLTSLRRRARITAMALAVFSLGAIASGCTSPTSALAPSAGTCFQTLPVAAADVGQNATLLGVRLLSAGTINSDLERHHEEPIPLGGLSPAVRLCLVGYRGPFGADHVISPWPPGRGEAIAALVVFSPDRRRVLFSILLNRLPLRIGRI